MVAGLPGVTTTAVFIALAAVLIGAIGGYGLYAFRSRRARDTDSEILAQLRDRLAGRSEVAIVVPENPSVDALAAALGIQALLNDWGTNTTIYAETEVTAEDASAFCNIFDASPTVIDDRGEHLAGVDGVVVVGGGGPVPTFARAPVDAVVRHRPATSDEAAVLAQRNDGATSTTVTALIQESGVTPDQRVATALLYGIRAGTQEFQRVRSRSDYEAAAFLHDYADQGRIEALRSPGMGAETFDIIGTGIDNRERRESVAVTNVGSVPSVGALEQAADTMLRLDGVSSAAVFGVHDDAVVAVCRVEDVRTNAKEVLESAFDEAETVGGNTETATVRVPLGLFSQVDEDHQGTLDELIDASTRSAIFEAFEAT